MKRSAFTMIELVFVIVILGILAAVAVPKLVTSRDDANLVSAATDIKNAISDVTHYVIANGSFALDSSDMTNVVFSATTMSVGSVDYSFGGDVDCVSFDGSSGTDLVVTTKNGPTALCAKLHDRMGMSANSSKSYKVTGSGVGF